MSTRAASPPRRRSRRLLRKLGWTGVFLILVLVLIYFVATSEPFVRGVVVPQVARTLDSTLTVSGATVKPFSQIVLRDVALTTEGDNPLFTAREFRLRHSLWSILSGTIRVEELLLDSPSVHILLRADGTSNLDPLLRAFAKSESDRDKEKAAPEDSEPVVIDIQRVALKNGHFQVVRELESGGREIQELNPVDVELKNLKNGSTGQLEWQISTRLASESSAGATGDLLAARCQGQFIVALDQAMQLSQVQGTVRLETGETAGQYTAFQGILGTLECDVAKDDLREVLLQFKRNEVDLGRIELSGPFDPVKNEGRLLLTIRDVDRDLLNIFGEKAGLDFGQTSLSATNLFVLDQGGNRVSAEGQWRIGQAGLARGNQQSPRFDLEANYHVWSDSAAQRLGLDRFELRGRQDSKEVLLGSLSRPMTVSWSTNAETSTPTELTLSVTDHNLGAWKSFLPEMDPSGNLGLSLKVQVEDLGKKIAFELNSTLTNLGVQWDSRPLQNLSLETRFAGALDAMNLLDLKEASIRLLSLQQPVLDAAASGSFHLGMGAVDATLRMQSDLPQLLTIWPTEGMALEKGRVNLQGKLAHNGHDGSITGLVEVADLTGKLGDGVLQDYQVQSGFDLALGPNLVEIKRALASVRHEGQDGGSLIVQGRLDDNSGAGQIQVALRDLNQFALRPFLEPALGGRKLVSVSLHSTNALSLSKQLNEVRSSLSLDNLVVQSPNKAVPEKPLAAAWLLEAAMTQSDMELRQGKLTLSPTHRAKNELNVTGRLKTAATNGLDGAIKVVASTLDLTPYYDLVASEEAEPIPAPDQPDTVPTIPGEPPREPDATTLPVRHVTAGVRIAKLYLRELELSDLDIQSQVTSNRVEVNPCQMTINAKPMNASFALDLSQPGYGYEVALRLDEVPLGPFAKAFVPDQADLLQADLLVDLNLSGAGMTEPNIIKNLRGDVTFGFTNANMTFLGAIGKNIVGSIATVLRLHELPSSPLRWAMMNLSVTNSTLDVSRFAVLGDFYSAASGGRIQLQPVLTNTVIPDIPVYFALERSVAHKANLIPGGTPPDTPYVLLPQFITLQGTFGAVKTKLDTAVIAGLLAKSTAGLPAYAGKEAGKVIEGVGKFLTGEGLPGVQSDASTNEGIALKLLKLPGRSIGKSGDLIQEGSDFLQAPTSLLGGNVQASISPPGTVSTNVPPPTVPDPEQK